MEAPEERVRAWNPHLRGPRPLPPADRGDRHLSVHVPLGRTCRGMMARPGGGSSRSSSGSKGPVVGPPPLSLDDSWWPCVLAHGLMWKHMNCHGPDATVN